MRRSATGHTGTDTVRTSRPAWVQANQCFHVVDSGELWQPKRCKQSAHWLVPEYPYCESHQPIRGLGLLMERLDIWEQRTRLLFERLTLTNPAMVMLPTAADEERWQDAINESRKRHGVWRAQKPWRR